MALLPAADYLLSDYLHPLPRSQSKTLLLPLRPCTTTHCEKGKDTNAAPEARLKQVNLLWIQHTTHTTS